MKYSVGIDKAYFPKDSSLRFTTLYDVAVVEAETRSEAARKAWEQFSPKWLEEILPTVKQVSLYVSSPKAGSSGLMTRLDPITVWRKI